MTTERRVPAELLARVQRDLRPVRPLAGPARRALALVPLGLLLLVGAPVFWGWRDGFSEPLAPWPSWALSAVETAAGLSTLAVGFREAVPGRELSKTTLVGLIGLVWLGFLGVNAATQMPVPAAIPLATNLRWIRECVADAAAFSVPALGVVGWLVARALPGRPGWTGALAGLGVGMMADAGLRLFCRDGALAHIVVAHGGAIAAVMALGALGGWLVERIKARS
jgi:hypothetical protein